MPLPDHLRESFAILSERSEEILNKGAPHSYSRLIFTRLGLREDDFQNFVREANASFRARLAAGTEISGSKIQKIVHRLWVTAPDDGHMPFDRYIDEIAEKAKETPAWRHVFWVNSRPVAGRIQQRFKEASAPIEVAPLEKEFEGDPLWHAAQEFIARAKFVSASDIVRMMILRDRGGLYADLGVRFTPELLDLIEHAGAMLNIDSQRVFQIVALAFPAGHPFMRLWCAVCLNPEKFCTTIHGQGSGISAIEELSYLSAPGFTALATFFCRRINPF